MSDKINIIINELFQSSLVTYLILLFLETISNNFVSRVFNLNILLGVVIVSGIIKILPLAQQKIQSQWEIIDQTFSKLHSQIKTTKNISEKDFYSMIIFSFGGGLFIYIKTQEIGQISVILSVIASIIIFLLYYLIFTDND